MKKLFLLLFLSIILLNCAGSYYYAEPYLLDISRTDLIDKIRKFKDENPEYKSITIESGIPEEYPKDHRGELFYSFYFYLPEKEMIVHSVMNMSEQISDNPANFAFTGVTKNKNLGGWKSINTRDLSRKENKEIKRMFETEILSKLADWKRD